MIRATRILFFLALFCGAANLRAQVDLLTAPPDVTNHPTVKIPVKVQCDFVWQDNLDVSQFSVTEDGIPQSPLTLTCPPLNNRSPIALAMVGDRRAIMPGWATAKMKSAYKGFVNAFKTWGGVPDKGNVFGDSGPSQTMTPDKPTLISAVNTLDNNSGFSLTAMTNAINDLLANGGTASKQVVVTCCVDQPIYPSIAELLALNTAYNNAKNAGVIFHTVFVYTNPAIPFINDVIVQLLKSFAVNTGGLYFLCGSDAAMQAGYKALVNFLYTEIPYCTLSYQSRVACPDGKNREVIVDWSGCSGSDADTLHYTAPNDPNSLRRAQFALGSAVINGLEETQLPFNLASQYQEVVLYPFTLTLAFDPTFLTLKSVETVGDLAEGFTPSITPNAGGALVAFTGPPKIIPGSGILCHFTFAAGDPDNDVTVPVAASPVLFSAGCLKQDSSRAGSIRIVARKPAIGLQCSADSPVLWDSTTSGYVPGLLTASVEISNSGNRGARNVRATIILPAGLQLVSGAPTQGLTPSTLDAGASGNLAWTLQPLERLTSDTLLLCFDIASDNHATVRCCTKVFVQERGPLLRISCSAEPVTVQNNKYVPMPFTVRADITNVGGMRAQPLAATIQLPPGLKLAAGEKTQKPVAPNSLRNAQSGTVSWLVVHQESPEDSTFDITICAASPNAREACCSLQVRIPRVNAPVMQTTCSAPDSLLFRASSGEYEPNPFTVSLATKNVGGLDAQNVRAVIILPPELVLDPPTQKDTIIFTPSLITPNSPAVNASWQIRALKQGKGVQTLIRFRIIGANFGDVDCEKALILPKAGSAAFACSLVMPDSLSVRPDGADYMPNPFTVNCTVRNTSGVASGALFATILLPSDLQSQSPVSLTIGSGVLAAGEQQQLSWDVLALPGASARGDRILVAVTEDSLQRAFCADTIRIPKLVQTLRLTCGGPDTIRFDRTGGLYLPDPFPVSFRVLNSGSIEARNVSAKILLPPELALASGSDSISVSSILVPSDAEQTGWSLRVVPQSGAVSVTVTIRVWADGLPPIECRKTIFIEGQSLALLACTVELPPSVSFTAGAYSPNPLTVLVHVRNAGGTPVSNISALLLTPADMAIDLGDQTLKQVAPATLAPGDTTSVAFRVRVYPHAAARVDTLVASLISPQAPPTLCAGTIAVDKALRPQFAILCTAPDTLRYDAVTRKFVPDPFPVNVSIRNTGDAQAANVYGIISVSGGLRLADAAQKFSTPTVIPAGGTGSVGWLLSPIKAPAAHTDSIYVQIRTDEFGIVESRCLSLVRSEAVNAPILSLTCAVPDSLTVSGGVYSPQQIIARATVRNTGVPASAQTVVKILLPPDFRLAAGETQAKTAGSGTLSSNEAQTVQWLLDVAPRGVEDHAPICFVAQASNADSTECCDDIFIPGRKQPGLSITCAAPALLGIDTLSGSYTPSPFIYTVRVTNTGTDPIQNVTSLLVLPSGVDPVAGGTFRLISATLAPGASASVDYQLQARARLQGDSLLLLARVSADQISEIFCARLLFVPALRQGTLFSVACGTRTDTITFIPQLNASQPASLRIGTRITNLGGAPIAHATAELLLPSGLSLLSGQGPSVSLTGIQPGIPNARSVSWEVTAARPDKDTLVPGLIRVTAEGATEQECFSSIQILVRANLPHIFVTEDILTSADRAIDVPIWIDARGVSLNDAHIEIGYDTARLFFQRAELLPDQRTRWLQPDVQGDAGKVRLDLRAIGGYVGAAPIFTLRFRTTPFPAGWEFFTVQSPLIIPAGEVNSRSLKAETTGKTVIIAGPCLPPLAAGSGFKLMQNVPNPANPSTTISYLLPRDGNVLLTLHDMYGRRISTLADRFESAGLHTLALDLSAYPSGLYIYELAYDAGTLFRKMIIAK